MGPKKKISEFFENIRKIAPLSPTLRKGRLKLGYSTRFHRSLQQQKFMHFYDAAHARFVINFESVFHRICLGIPCLLPFLLMIMLLLQKKIEIIITVIAVIIITDPLDTESRISPEAGFR